MTIPVGLSATFTVTKKGNGAPLIVAANRRLINTQWEERPFGYVEVVLQGDGSRIMRTIVFARGGKR